MDLSSEIAAQADPCRGQRRRRGLRLRPFELGARFVLLPARQQQLCLADHRQGRLRVNVDQIHRLDRALEDLQVCQGEAIQALFGCR